MLKWDTGNWTSRRTDGGSFIEKHSDDRWYVYNTDEGGTIVRVTDSPLLFAPPVAGPFRDLEAAQAWSEENQPPRDPSAPID